ncbi:MAG TPA: delta-60 repeat domain-containing protein [Rudaea sp.]|jgi:uncharacterized delta-60 repeat protein
MSRLLRLVVTLALLGGAVVSASAYAVADGYFDPDWAGSGRIVFPGNFTDTLANSQVRQTVVESNGNILLAGLADHNNGIYWWLGELFANGQFVPTFGPSDGSGRTTSCQLGFACAPGVVEFPEAILVQPDEKYLLLSSHKVWRTTAHAHAFDVAAVTGGTGYVANNYQINDVQGIFNAPTGMALQPDGKILLVGTAVYSAASTSAVFGVVRLNADLSLDTGFNAIKDGLGVTFAGGVAIPVADDDTYELSSAILLQSDGGIVLVGAGETATNSVRLEAVRLTANGSLDPDFGVGGKMALAWSGGSLAASQLTALTDRAGRIDVVPGLPGSGMLVARLTAAGSADATFGDSGFAFNDAPQLPCTSTGATALAIDSAGRIVVAGACDNNIGIERLRGDTGALDTSFGVGGFGHGVFETGDTVSVANAIVMDQSGHPIIAGLTATTVASQQFAGVARLTYDLIYTNNFEEAPRGCLPPDCN